MANGNAPIDVPGPVAHLQALARTFDDFDSQWRHLRVEELGSDFFYSSGLPQPLINATTAVYGAGRDLAMGLANEFGSVTNPGRFPDVSHFIRYFESRIISRVPELEAVVAHCENELAAISADSDADAVFAERQAQWGMRALSSAHLKRTIGEMIRLFREQLTLLNTAASDVATLKRAQSPGELAIPSADQRLAPEYMFYRGGEYWEIAFEGQSTRHRDRDGFRYIAYLLARPHQEVGIMILRQLGDRRQAADPDDIPNRGHNEVKRQRIAASELVTDDDGDDFVERQEHGAKGRRTASADEVVDPAAIKAVLKQLSDLQEEMAEAHNEEEREEIRNKCDALRAYVGEMKARFARPLKRAGSTVQKRIAKAQELIGRGLPRLELHLRQCLRTGNKCIYRPDRLIPWQFEPPGPPSARRLKPPAP
jgi:hypothetical protein